MRIFVGLLSVVCATMIGCSESQDQDVALNEQPTDMQWIALNPEEMTETQIAQQELCLSATNALASELMGELMAALDSDDPTAGITVCGAKAPAIAANITEEYGVKIGRTSHKLRNAANVPPDWAQPIVADQVGEPTYLSGPNGEFGALLPIRLKAECQMCHGITEEIDAAVLQALTEQYPDDAATGFAEGDLRGWFWIEASAGEVTS